MKEIKGSVELLNVNPPSFKDFSKTIKIYKVKYKWMNILPSWLLRLFIKPAIFYNCFPKQIGEMTDDSGDLIYNVEINFNNFIRKD